ncbi:hypothetical protein B7P43_G07247 [Cryptotermes secundus]|uniref:DUF4817 domain-containing protein n=1 Tax=Cryptotermes secundus TaxID=105785 RepID=A0A2J7RC08_9NEOP|nr:hypothetical protein B7P43_G07247 [Cryptotermes secundus]
MATQQEKAYCVLRFEVSKSIVTVCREFRVRFQKEAPYENNIRRWYRQFVDSGCLCKGKSSGRPHVPHADVERVRETYQRSTRKSLQLANDSNNYIFQQDGAPPHFHSIVRGLLDLVLPQRWIGRAAGEDAPLLWWPPRSLDITPCDFFLWWYVKDMVYVPPLPQSLQDLQNRINRAVETITPEMLQRVWQVFDYRIDVCRVTKGAHIEAL